MTLMYYSVTGTCHKAGSTGQASGTSSSHHARTTGRAWANLLWGRAEKQEGAIWHSRIKKPNIWSDMSDKSSKQKTLLAYPRFSTPVSSHACNFCAAPPSFSLMYLMLFCPALKKHTSFVCSTPMLLFLVFSWLKRCLVVLQHWQ